MQMGLAKKDLNDFRVTYKNVFNETTIPDLTENEHNLLMTVISRLDRNDSKEIVIPFSDLSEIVDSRLTGHPNETIALIDSLWSKIKGVDYKLYTGNQAAGGVLLFSYLSANKDKQLLEVQINPSLKYFVNDFEEGRYSSLDYRDFKRTAGKYGKLLFRVLNEKKNMFGYLKISLEELVYLLDAAPAYRESGSRFNERVLKPAIKSLAIVTEYITCTSIKTGRMITGFEFEFKFKNRPSSNQSTQLINSTTEQKVADNKFKNNFEDGYVATQNKTVEQFRTLINQIGFISTKRNAEYFNIRSSAKSNISKIYSELVGKDKSNTWTPMTYLACIQFIVKHNRPMMQERIEDAYTKIKGILMLEDLFEPEILSKLSKVNVLELKTFLESDADDFA